MHSQQENIDNSSNDSSEQLLSPSLTDYSQTIEEAAHYYLARGFRVAPRTIAWHCQTNLLDCRKFTQGNVLKWKITQQSLDERIETLKREGVAVASSNAQLPAGQPAGNSELQHASASELGTEIIKILKDELHEKNQQITEFQAIIRDHNQQLENLNDTIQLSNQTIQQLNRTLALPQVKDVVVASMQRRSPENHYPTVDNPTDQPEQASEPFTRNHGETEEGYQSS